VSEYGVHLREKQRFRRTYAVLERQFKGYFEVARSRPGVTGENLLRLLEMRLDNVVFRMGFATSRAQARQLVGHGHFAVNGRATNIPSFQVKAGDRIDVRESHRSLEPFKMAKVNMGAAVRPEWVNVDPDKLTGTVLSAPRRDQMPAELNEQLVIEYYSR
jgi:small subunit ribosomal protein S4